MPTSYVPLEVTLTLNRRIQYLVLASAALLYGLGAGLILRLDIHVTLRALGLLVFSIDVLRESRIIWSGLGKFRAVDITSDGSMRLRSTGRAACPVMLRSGSLINSQFAWLRLRDQGGRDAALLILRSDAAGHTWQRFQLIWRQADENFGRLPRS